MNRRRFIKGFASIAALPLIIDVSEEEEATIANTTTPPEVLYGPYLVYFYERKQGEWVFSENIKDSFNRGEFNNSSKLYSYIGYMRDGKIHFQSFDKAVDFIHLDQKWVASVKESDETFNLPKDGSGELIYDIYYKNPKDKDSVEVQVAHYWFNRNTNSAINYLLSNNADNTLAM